MPKLYDKARWFKMAKYQLQIEPFCKMCADKGIETFASVVDHVERHSGDQMKFWFGKLQSLCADCHNRSKQQIEVRGFVNDIGVDGFPLDKRHPFYGA